MIGGFAMCKKLISFIMAVFIVFNSSLILYADDSIPIYLDNEKLIMSTSPILENGRMLVPMRAIFEKVGAEVEWNSENRQVLAIKGETTLLLTIDSQIAFVNGIETLLDVPAKIINSSTMVPVRFVSENLNMDVSWNEDLGMVFISSDIIEKFDAANQFIEYQTQLKDNIPDGFGRKFSENGDLIYTGQFKGGLFEGFGSFSYVDEGKYSGEFKNGERNGHGTFKWIDNEIYTGQWLNDKMNGYGMYSFKNGDKYEGSWVDNNFSGEGTYFFTDGKIFKGTWENGVNIGGGFIG